MTSISMTLEKTLAWRENWGQSDVRIIEEDLAALGATSYRTVGKQYVACRNAAGRVVARIHPGYIVFPERFVPADLRGRSTWRVLSTFQRRDESLAKGLENSECCTLCFMRLPLTGVCDCTD